MGSALWVKALLACTGLFAVGGVAGIGLANFASDGAFEFYRQTSMADLRPSYQAEVPTSWQVASAYDGQRLGGAPDSGVVTSLDR